MAAQTREVSPEVFKIAGQVMMNSTTTNTESSTFQRRWRSMFGASPLVCCKLWVLLARFRKHMTRPQHKHLLWALMFLRKYSNDHDLANTAAGGWDDAVDEKTFRKWIWLFVEAISFLEMDVILWENRKVDDILNDALISVDGTDTRQPKKRPYWSGWYSHKFNAGGTRWEVGVCLRTGFIVWIHGPFPCGRWPDLNIFRHALLSHLEAGEKVEADDGYVGEPLKTLTPALNSKTALDRQLRQQNRNRQESFNKRLKDWKCLEAVCKHNLAKHSSMFRAVAVICQLAIESGEPLFHVDYNDEDFSWNRTE